MHKTLKLIPIPIFAAIILSVFSIGVFGATLTSSSGEYTVTHNAIALNHTNDYNASLQIDASASITYIAVNVTNGTTGIDRSYGQPYVSALCGSDSNGYKPFVQDNATFHNSTMELTSSSSENFYIVLQNDHFQCGAGRFFGTLTLTNNTNSSDSIDVNVTIDVPVTKTSGTFNNLTDVATFNGSLAGNSTEAHVLFFNTSRVFNATSFTINLNAIADMDIFVVDNSGSLRAYATDADADKSITQSFTGSSNEMWEIRIHGDLLQANGYGGIVAFSTLDVTNASSGSNLLDYDSVTPETTVSTDVTVENVGPIGQTVVLETSEIKKVESFATSNDTAEFRTLVPDFTQTMRIILNWTAEGTQSPVNFTLSANGPDGNEAATSVNNHNSANISNVDMTEIIEISNPTQGEWTFVVSNATTDDGSTNNYNVDVEFFVDASDWIATNFSSLPNSTFDVVGSPNSSHAIEVNLTVPRESADGTYEGFVGFNSSTGAVVQIPIQLTVASATIAFNQTFNSSTHAIVDNVGQNFTRTISIPFNNTGTVSGSFEITNSSSVLTDISNSSNTLRFSYAPGASPITAGEDRAFTLTVYGNTSETNDVASTYAGWLFINATNSYPDQGHNLTINTRLGSDLLFQTVSISGSNGNDTIENNQIGENFTAQFQLALANETIISQNREGQAFNTTNFTVYLTHANDSSIRTPSAGGLTLSNLTDSGPLFSGGTFNLNFSVPNLILGGPHILNLETSTDSLSVGQLTYTASKTFEHLNVDNVSIKMSTNQSGCSIGQNPCTTSEINLDENERTTVSVFITNYGTRDLDGTGTYNSVEINMTESCPGYTTESLSAGTNCSASASNQRWTINALAPGETCYIAWNFTAGTNDESACLASLNASVGSDIFFQSAGINFNVDVNNASSGGGGSSEEESSSSSSGGGGSSGSTTTTTSGSSSSSDAKFLQISKWTTIIEVVQGETKESVVTVKNINDTLTQTISLSVTDFNSTIGTSISPATASISAGNSNDYTVTFDATSDGLVVDEYAGKFKASSTKGDVTVDFNLQVLPGAEAQEEINATFISLSEEFQDLWKEINSSTNAGVNTSSTMILFDQLQSKVNEANSFLALGTEQGYFAASQLEEEIRNLLATTRAQLKVDKQESGFVFPVDPLYIGIAVGIVAAGFLVYLFLPSSATEGIKSKIGGSGLGSGMKKPSMGKSFSRPSFKPKFGFGGVGEKISSAASSAKEKASDHANATKEKVSSTGGGASDNFKKLQEKFRGKKKYKYRFDR